MILLMYGNNSYQKILFRLSRGLTIVLLFLAIYPPARGADQSHEEPYIYGVFPYLPVNNMEEIHAPIAKQFSIILGHPVKVVSRSTYELFRNAVENQSYDLIYIQPFGYVRSAAPNNYVPLARFVSIDDKNFSGTIRAQVVTLASDPIDDINLLEHRIVAMPAADAAVSVLGVAFLKQNGLVDGKNITTKYFINHFSCLDQLVINKASACISALPAIRLFESEKKVALKIIATSQAIPSSLIAVSLRIPELKRRQLREEIINWQNTQVGISILKKAKWRGFISTTDKDYDLVREIWNDVRGSD